MENIPIIDLKAQYETIAQEVESSVLQVLRSGNYILSAENKALESELSQFLGVKYAVAVNSGTTALHLALASLDIKAGDEVITSPFTFIATAEAISYLGAKPIFVDIDLDTYCLDPEAIRAKITNKTKAIMPVHLYGHSADMDPILAIAKEYNLKVVEDCAQSIACQYKDKMTGAIGDLGCFSFFPTKNLGAMGEGGLITTNDENLYQKLLALRVHGSIVRYEHEMIGYNARLNEIQAAILRVKLKHLTSWTKKRQENASLYKHLLQEIGLNPPMVKDYSTHVYHQYAIRLNNRDQIMENLIKENIACAIHYPKPVYLQKAYASLGLTKGAMPNSEIIAAEILSLPVYPELSDEKIKFIVSVLKRNINV